jgi:hypothetical protein
MRIKANSKFTINNNNQNINNNADCYFVVGVIITFDMFSITM